MRIGLIPEGTRERLVLHSRRFPLPLFDVMGTMLLSRAVMASVRFGLFDRLASEPKEAAALAAEAGLNPLGIELLLEALVASGYLVVEKGHYRNSPLATRWLLSASATTLVNFVRYNYHQWEWFSHLEEFIEGGRAQNIHEQLDQPQMWRDYMLGLRDLATLSADELAEKIEARAPRHLLDLGGGHGYYSIAMCRRHPGLRATVVDLEPAARIGRELVEQAGLSSRIEFRTGNLAVTPLGENYDLAFLFNVVHHLDEATGRATLRRLYTALGAKGLLVIWEPFREAGRRKDTDQLGSLLALYFGVTSARRAYSFGQVTAWARAAGFARIKRQTLRTAPFAALLLAEK